MTARTRLALATSPGALTEAVTPLRRAGVIVRRWNVVGIEKVPPARWLPPLLRTSRAFDALIVTSGNAVSAGVEPLLHALAPDRIPRELWAVGPSTARVLARVAHRRVRRPANAASATLAAAIGRDRSRALLYLRSDRAGPGLARLLRRAGHRVREVTVYRLSRRPALSPRDQAWLRNAHAVLASSPSALEGLRKAAGLATWSHLRRSVPLVVLGGRSRRAARAAGFQDVRLVEPAGPQRFTLRLLGELRREPAGRRSRST